MLKSKLYDGFIIKTAEISRDGKIPLALLCVCLFFFVPLSLTASFVVALLSFGAPMLAKRVLH